jgi:CheY-like chemotaxis protein
MEGTALARIAAIVFVALAITAAAIDMVRRVRPALVLTDLYMPGGDGDELCRTLKADPETRGLPVLMMSGGGHKDESARCHAAGCDDFLVKPVRQAELLLAASRHMHARLRSLRPRIRVPIVLETGGTRHTGHTVDVSLGGLFVETSSVLVRSWTCFSVPRSFFSAVCGI